MAEVLGTLSVRVGVSRTPRAARPARRGDLQHLGVQALAHLGAAVVHLHAAVVVDVHQRAGLVERGVVEGDAELHRRDGQAALGVRVAAFQRGDLARCAPRRRRARAACSQTRGEPLRVAHALAVGRASGPRRRSCGAHLGGPSPSAGAAVEHVLDDQHALRAAEAAERRVRGLVRLRDPAVHPHVRQKYALSTWHMARVSTGSDRSRLQPPSDAARVERLQPAVVVEAGAPAGENGWRLPVIVMSWARLSRTRTGRPVSTRQRGDGREPVRLRLLAAEAAAHAQALHDHLRVAERRARARRSPGSRSGAGWGLHEHLAGLVDERQRAVGLEVEVLLTGELELAAKTCAACAKAGLDVTALDARRRPGSCLRRSPRCSVTTAGRGS